MHLLVLSASRLCPTRLPADRGTCLNAPSGAQCFPTVVTDPPYGIRFMGLNATSGAQCFPTGSAPRVARAEGRSQCTFWCSVLPDWTRGLRRRSPLSLNAPSGAQCFPTRRLEVLGAQRHVLSQCTFWCSVLPDNNLSKLTEEELIDVSMHLLVLSASRRDGEVPYRRVFLSQCTFWCSVLPDGMSKSRKSCRLP